MKGVKLISMMTVLIWAVAFTGCTPANQESDQPKPIADRGFTEQDVIDSYIYVLGRYLVIRQEHIDIAEEGVDYNVIKYNELGKAEFVNPNLDVAYLEAWFAVDESTPVILEIPKIEGRYYTAQIVDEWAEIITNINERNYPDHPYGRYALCLTGSDPVLPEGVLRIDLPSKKAKMLARVERQGDDAGAVELQESFRIIKTGKPEIDRAVDIPMFSNDALLTVEVFDQPMLDQVLQSAPDVMSIAPDFQASVRKIAAYAAQSSENRQEVNDVIVDKALPEFFRLLLTYGDVRGGWSATTGYPTGFGDDYIFRTGANYAGIWWNANREVVYFMGNTDEDGEQLNGDEVYEIHYPPNALPDDKVHAYWSMTMLSFPEYRVTPNRLDKFSINNLTSLEYAEDGSLTLYLASELPDGVPQGNWLPSPEGQPFIVNTRLYVPKYEVIAGKYFLPPIQRVD